MVRRRLHRSLFSLFAVPLLPARAQAQSPSPSGERTRARLFRRGRGHARARRTHRRCAGEHAAPRRRSLCGRAPAASRSCSPTAARCISISDTTLDLQSDELVRLIDGRAPPLDPGPSRESRTASTPAAAGRRSREPGEYRVALLRSRRNELELAVLRGRAELVNEDGRTPLRAGERAFARAERRALVRLRLQLGGVGRLRSLVGSAPRASASASRRSTSPKKFAPIRRVVRSLRRLGLRRVVRVRVVSARRRRLASVLPRPLGARSARMAGRGSAAIRGHGRRITTAAGDSRRRLVLDSRAARWGPAWVSWAYAPGYVSWCPLGWNNRPWFSSSTYGYRGYDPWRAWTVVPHRHLRRRLRAPHRRRRQPHRRTHARRLRSARLGAPTSSVTPSRAVPSAAPIRVAGTAASRQHGDRPLLSEPRRGRA